MKVWKGKRINIYRLLSFFLSFYLLFVTSINSYASTTESGSASDWSGAQKADWVTNNLMWICAEGFDFVAQDTILQGVGSKVASKVESLVHDNPEYTSYDSWWERHFGFNPSPNTTPNYDKPIDQNSISNVYWDQSVTNIFNEAIQETVAENPLSYKEASITSYKNMNTSVFDYYALYANLQEFMKQRDGYFICSAGIEGNGSIRYNLIRVNFIPRGTNIGFVGNVIGGSFSNVQLSVNWTLGNQPQNYDSKIEKWIITTSGIEKVTDNRWWFSCNTLSNSATIGRDSANGQVVFTSLPKNEYIYVFANNNAYKAYNSGSPQPYYFGSGYGSATGSVNLSTSNMSNSGNYYSNVVNNIQSGWSAEQVLELVDKIIASGGGSGSGSGSSDSDSLDLGWLGKIGGVIVKIVNAITSVVTDIIDGIANALIGEDGTGGIVGTLKTILHNVVELVTEDFTDFMSEIFGFLPPEISTILIAGISLSVFFGVIKILRK